MSSYEEKSSIIYKGTDRDISGVMQTDKSVIMKSNKSKKIKFMIYKL